MRSTAIITLGIMWLAGCKADFTGDASISAALAAAAGQVSSMTGVLAIEAGSEVSCRKHAPDLIKALAVEYPGAAFLGCAAHGYDTMAEFRLTLPVLTLTKGDRAPVPLSFTTDRSDNLAMIGLYLETQAVNRILSSLPDAISSQFNGAFEPTVTLDLRNDTAATVEVRTNGAFVDGVPRPFASNHSLASGQMLRIQPSDVNRAQLGNGGVAFLFGVEVPE